MKKFFYDMFSANKVVSTKRVAAMLILLNVIVLTYIATFRNADHITPEFMFNALCMLAGGGIGLTALENIFQKNKPTDNVGE